MNVRVIKWCLYGEGTTYILRSHTQFYICFLLSNDRITLNRWWFTYKMTFRMVFQTDLEVCYIEPDVTHENRGSSFSTVQQPVEEESASDFTVCYISGW